MNKLTKIGLSALAGSLVAISAHAGSLSVSGSASISFADGDTDNAGGTAAETAFSHPSYAVTAEACSQGSHR